ncbi:transposase-like protein [Anaerospora hongkongensis]|uniref:Transposase-like protein n=1 Tax=Anaerospora hongkongensis TaxID=244830 RepID=A0A4R1Q0B4_9FIRM|nr:helix-turn-helix domain-containing protein [Anaerospora hongkongensis]TCL39100.1 transposase-like protein [Anaerospora hongkongensis]
MSKKSRYSSAEKLAIIHEFEQGDASQRSVTDKYNVDITTIKRWIHRLKHHGLKGLEDRSQYQSYSAELKLSAVHDFLSGESSQKEIIERYKILSCRQLRDWIKKYNSHSSFKSTGTGGTSTMTRGRPTDWKERIDIVLYCLANNRDYQGTATKYQVSYQQVYQWVAKYESGGEEALTDGRGRKKALEELTDTERQKLAMKKLEYENERLRAENALLKKLQQFERG